MNLSKELIPTSLELPPVYTNENIKDPIAHVHWVAPLHGWEWLILERGSEDEKDLLFGYVKSPLTHGKWELGYVSLSEIESVGIVCRNGDFVPTPVSQLM